MEPEDNKKIIIAPTATQIALAEHNDSLQKFTTTLNYKPRAKAIKVNRMANDSLYLPISFIEMQLDKCFFGLWSTENFTYQLIANEVVGSLELKVFHPIAKVWLTRVGAAAAMIQFKSELDPSDPTGKRKLPTNITDVSKKIQNTLVKDFPHLRAECLKNAAKTLGVFFGRDLNRKEFDDYEPYDFGKALNK